MRAWLIFLAGLWMPTIDKEPIMRRASKWLDDLIWRLR